MYQGRTFQHESKHVQEVLQAFKVVLVLHEAVLENLKPVDFEDGVAVRVANAA